MKSLPQHVVKHSTTPVFTEATLPQGLLKDHQTKEGMWGVIEMQKGEMEYIIHDGKTHLLNPETKGIIEPGIVHHIKPCGPVSFFITFYKE